MQTKGIVGIALIALAVAGAADAWAEEAPETADLLLVLDASGSMWGQVDGENKIVIARRVFADLVDGLPDGQQTGLIAYGHRRKNDCEDIELVAPLGALDRSGLKATVAQLDPKGKTPITASLEAAFDAAAAHHRPTKIVLLTDGLETCGGDPCATARAAKERGLDYRLYIVGFDVADEDVSQLECAAQAGEGRYLTAGSAAELSEAMRAAVATPTEVPAGRLSIKAVADGELQDVAIRVMGTAGEEVEVGRTYASPETNPRLIPLEDGSYTVEVRAVGIDGSPTRSLSVEVASGSLVEKEVDFSAGELVIGVTRNGRLADAVFHVYAPEGTKPVAQGRTYTGASGNPAVVRLTAGDYRVEVGAVEISGKPWVVLGAVTVEPQGRVDLSHDFASGTLAVGALRGGELADAVVHVSNAAGQVAQGRTYTAAATNPKVFQLEPGSYRVSVKAIGASTAQEIDVTVVAEGTAEHMVELD